MNLITHCCQACGGNLNPLDQKWWKCESCGKRYEDASVEEATRTLQSLFDEERISTINNLRKNLWKAINAEYISSTDVKYACTELKKYLPDDFRANFFEIAAGTNVKQITQAIREIDVESNRNDIDDIMNFLIASIRSGNDFLLELNNLAERAYKKTDFSKYNDYATKISQQAALVDAGIYDTTVPRHVFVAYSSKDMKYVSKLVEELESQELKCFVAARNLRHGVGSVENYNYALQEAIDNCRSFVFVSSPNSRSIDCDAVRIEMTYVKKQDISSYPQYRNNYAAMPIEYKKPRVQYMVKVNDKHTGVDDKVDEFFDGYEWANSPKEVAKRVFNQLLEADSYENDRNAEGSNTKLCVKCGKKVSKDNNFCPFCAGADFVSNISDFIELKNKQEDELKRHYEEENKHRQEEEARRLRAEETARRTEQANQTQYTSNVPSKGKKSRIFAAVLALFLGYYGVDQFYMGNTKKGIARIITSVITCGIVGLIWSLIDFIRILFGRVDVNSGKSVKALKKAQQKNSINENVLYKKNNSGGVYSGKDMISRITSIGANNINDCWPSGSYSSQISISRFSCLFFHVFLKRPIGTNRSVHLDFTVYDKFGNVVADLSSELALLANHDRISKGYVLRGQDGTTLMTGMYHVEISIDGCNFQSYFFELVA